MLSSHAGLVWESKSYLVSSPWAKSSLSGFFAVIQSAGTITRGLPFKDVSPVFFPTISPGINFFIGTCILLEERKAK